MNSVKKALITFTERYVTECRHLNGSEPISYAHQGMNSPCIVRREVDKIFWLPKEQEESFSFQPLEELLQLVIHDDAKSFYASQYAADIAIQYREYSLQLLQLWSFSDGEHLQENILGHLLTQRRKKQTPTIFIGLSRSESEVISLCNMSGNVLLEDLKKGTREILTESLALFLEKAYPLVNQ